MSTTQGLLTGAGTAGASSPMQGQQPPMPATEPARTYQHYQVLRRADGSLWELGRGAMGITYKAFDVNLRCEVALKVVNAAMLNHANARERFVREARAAARLRHRNVATVHHLGSDAEQFFYAMEFIDGETLEALVRRAGPLPPIAALRVVLQTARALAAAARQNLVHRDIKPANLMLAHEDADDHAVVKVIDFGLARPTVGDGSGTLTLGGFVGTPQFASPEQLEEQPVDVRSDIYSLGVTLWFLLAGQPPFTGSLAGICDQHRHAPPPWDQLPAATPPPVRDLLAHMLEKNPAKRPQDPVELRREVEAALARVRGQHPQPGGSGPEEGGVPVAPRAAALAEQLTNGTEPESVSSPGALLANAFGNAPDLAASPGAASGRYELIRLLGEGARGRVFQARDRSGNGRLAAVRQLRPEILAAPGARERLDAIVRQVRAAPHPHLTELLALEPFCQPVGALCLVEEWLNGFTLLDLLAVRGGGLATAEGLRLLQQAAAAADHARRSRLDRLDLALHQIRLHFPRSVADLSIQPQARAALQAPMSEWAAWTLKIDPAAGAMGRVESTDHLSDVTLLPGAVSLLPSAATAESGGNGAPPVAGAAVRALARLTYELLGGTPPPPAAAARGNRIASLPLLNEAANAVLRQALSAEPGFETGAQFAVALAQAAGYHPETLQPAARTAAAGLPKATNGKSSAAEPLGKPRAGGAAGTRGQSAPLAKTSLLAGDTSRPLEAASFAGDITTLPIGRRERAAEARRRRFWVFAGVWAVLLCAGATALLWRQRDVSSGWRRLAASEASPAPSPARKHPGANKGASTASAASVFPRKPLTHPLRPPSPAASAAPKALPTPKPLPAVINGDSSSSAVAPAPSASLAEERPVSNPPAAPTPEEPTPAAASASAPPPAEIISTPAPPPEENTSRRVRVRVTSRPEGAEIFLRNESQGKAPMELLLPPGDYELVARYKNYPETHETVHLSRDQRETSVQLRPMPPDLVPIGPPMEPVVSSRREGNGRSIASGSAAVRRNAESSSSVAPAPIVLPAQPVGGGDSPAASRSAPPLPDPGPPRIMRARPLLTPFEPAPTASEKPAPAESKAPSENGAN